MNKVKVLIGRTLNTGNYESYRFDVGIELDCEDKEEGFKEAIKFCSEKSKMMTQKIKDSINANSIHEADV